MDKTNLTETNTLGETNALGETNTLGETTSGLTDTKTILYELLKHDRECRKLNMTDDLYRLCELKDKDWDYTVPTLTSATDVYDKDTFNDMSLEKFRSDFFKMYSMLRDFNWDNILIAGGCIGKFFRGSVNSQVDIDIFLYNLTPQEATERVKDICNDLVENEKKVWFKAHEKKTKNIISNVSCIKTSFTRTKGCLNIKLTSHTGRDINIQIIFRIYKTKSEILHGFDLGSSAVGFDGKDVWFTSLGKFAYEYGCNIIDLTRRSTTYESRLKKYFDRSFDIILPEFDITKLDLVRSWGKSNVCYLEHIGFQYTKINGSKIVVTQLYHDNINYSDYYDTDDSDSLKMFYTNLRYLLLNEYDKMVYTSDDLEGILNPRLMKKSFVDNVYSNIFERVKKQVYPQQLIEKYVDVVTPEFLFEHRRDRDILDHTEQKQLENVYSLLEKLYVSDCGISWLTENPSTQLTSSFNPVIENPKEWYGKCYLE